MNILPIKYYLSCFFNTDLKIDQSILKSIFNEIIEANSHYLKIEMWDFMGFKIDVCLAQQETGRALSSRHESILNDLKFSEKFIEFFEGNLPENYPKKEKNNPPVLFEFKFRVENDQLTVDLLFNTSHDSYYLNEISIFKNNNL